MTTLHHVCDECGSEFTIKYDEEQTEDSPHFCSFCGEMMVDIEDTQEDDE